MNTESDIKVTVSQRESLTTDIVLYRLAPIGAETLPPFTAGSHIDVHIQPHVIRSYSLCGDPVLAASHYCIAVKREDSGRGGSQAMHDVVQVGTELTISPPKNFFPLAENAAHHLLVAGGIGLTPMVSMVHTLVARGDPFTLVVCAHGEATLPFAQFLQDAPWSPYLFLNGRDSLDLKPILQTLPADSHIYCCGPEGMMATVKQQCESLFSDPLSSGRLSSEALSVEPLFSKPLLSKPWPSGQWHEERFVPKVTTAASTTFELYLSESDVRVQVPAGMTMIEALRNAGVQVESVCEQGICGSCLVGWKDGVPIHHDQCLDASERQEYIALCCAGCQSAALTLVL